MKQRNHLFSVLLLLGMVWLASCRTDPAANDSAVTFKHTENTAYISMPAEPENLNPLLTVRAYSSQVYSQIFLPLLGFDTESYQLHPVLATGRPSIENITEGPNQGGLRLTYELRPEARWDNGAPITAADVVFTYKIIFNPQVSAGPHRAYFEDYLVDVVPDPANDRRFTVVTSRPYILAEAATGNISIYPRYAYDPEGLLDGVALADLTNTERAAQVAGAGSAAARFATQFSQTEYGRDPGKVSGSGAYRLASWTPGQEVLLVKKDNWWGTELAADNARLLAGPDTISYRIIPDATAVFNAIANEDIDAVGQFDSENFINLRSRAPLQDYYRFATPPSYVYYFVGINNRRPKLADKMVRQALAHLVDIDAVVQLQDTLAQSVIGPVHPSKDYYAKDIERWEFSVEKARQKLEQAGWTDSDGDGIVDKMIDGQRQPLELNYILTSGSKFGPSFGELFQGNARKAGIKVNLNTMEISALGQALGERNFDLYAGGFSNQPVPDDFKQIFHSESDVPTGTNRFGFRNAQADDLIDRIRTTMDVAQRDDLYRQLQRLLHEEQPVIFLISPQDRIILSRRFEVIATSLHPGFMVNEFVQR